MELLHGTVRAGAPDDTVMAGGAEGEWPPSPARLFSALVAGDGTRARCMMTTGNELRWLEAQAPPAIHASPSQDVLASASRPRFVVVDATSDGAVQSYPARTSREVRPGPRQAPRDRTISYVWPEAAPPPRVLAGLAARAARVGYLGCADSPVRVSVSVSPAVGIPEPWRPDPKAPLTLPVPYPGFVDALDDAFDAWTSGGAMRRAWIRTARTGYRPPGWRSEARPAAPTIIWLRFDRAVSGRKLVALSETLRDAVLDHVQRLLPSGEEVPALLHGHREDGVEGPQARFLALPAVGHSRADGRLLGAAVWFPPGTDAELIQTVRSAVARLSGERLVKSGWFDLAVSVSAGERQPWASNPDRWKGPARRWVSATPVVHERWSKRLPGLEEIARWCHHADLPGAVGASFRRHPILPGALDLRPDQVRRRGGDHHPYSHMHVDFAERVTGPVVLGRGRHLGLGLMAPADNAAGDERG